jgi:peroxiredoxin
MVIEHFTVQKRDVRVYAILMKPLSPLISEAFKNSKRVILTSYPTAFDTADF